MKNQTAHFSVRPTRGCREAERRWGAKNSALTITQNQERFKQDINTTIVCDGMLNIAQGFNSLAWCQPLKITAMKTITAMKADLRKSIKKQLSEIAKKDINKLSSEEINFETELWELFNKMK